jgi:hypothetical protein
MEIAMKQHDITKICADSLRSFLNEKYDIKLGASHAHELVAAFLEYKSRAALLADNKYPIDNLAKAEFILLEPSISFIDQRLKSLEGLSSDLPSSSILAEVICSAIKNNAQFFRKILPSFRELALFLADERLNQEMKMWRIDSQAFNWIKDVSIQKSEAEVLMTVSLGYHTNAGERLRYRKYDIRLPRIAANLGFGQPELQETHYSGDAAKYSDEVLLKKYPVILTPVA